MRDNDGNFQGLAPGGVYEAQFGDNQYKVLWRERLVFARAALKANVPILPVFTENIRYENYTFYKIVWFIFTSEAFRVFPFGNKFFYWLFLKTRLPLRPVFGGFPVKLRTHIGEPIYPVQDMTPEMLRDECKVNVRRHEIEMLLHIVYLFLLLQESLEKIIADHQRIPGGVMKGIFDRFFKKKKFI